MSGDHNQYQKERSYLDDRRDEIIKLAREAEISFGLPPDAYPEQVERVIARLERFAALVAAAERNRTWTQKHWTEYERSIAAAEREACARVCETEWSNVAERMYAQECAAAIRARGQA